MGFLKVVFGFTALVVAVGLLTGVLQLFRELPDGSARFEPHLARGTVGWYRQHTAAALGPGRLAAIEHGLTRLTASR